METERQTERYVKCTDQVYMCDYEPGNMTRYEVALVKLPRGFLFSWTNGLRGGRAMRIACDLDASYLAEKLGHDVLADLVPLLIWINRVSRDHFDNEIPVHISEHCGFDPKTGLRR